MPASDDPSLDEPDSDAFGTASLIAGVWELVVDASPTAAAAGMLGALLDQVGDQGGGPVGWWVEPATAEHDTAAEEVGLVPTRTLLQLRRDLPAEAPPPLAVRPYAPGADEHAWLEVNNRAFAWHPDQGGWDLDRLEATMAEPWFDPAGFLLHEEEGRLAGFCWTKVHIDPEHLGEIFVIAVDPDFAGRGLGRSLTLAGLDHLWRERHTPTGMLYVESDNRPALALYDHLGFTTHHRRTRYEGSIPASDR